MPTRSVDDRRGKECGVEMRTLLLRIAMAAPLTLAALFAPFLLSGWVQVRFGLYIPQVVTLGIGLALAFATFFAIAGKQMKQVDEEPRRRRRA